GTNTTRDIPADIAYANHECPVVEDASSTACAVTGDADALQHQLSVVIDAATVGSRTMLDSEPRECDTDSTGNCDCGADASAVDNCCTSCCTETGPNHF